MTPTEYDAVMAANIEQREWQGRVDRTRPSFHRRCTVARSSGTCTDAGYSTLEYALTMVASTGHLFTLGACRFADPAGTIRRYLATVAR